LLAEAGSGALTLGTPSSPGIPEKITSSTVLVPYNDLGAVEAALKKYSGQIAGIIVEPIAGNMGLVPPLAGYLPGLRQLCDEYETLLIFDEVMSGFRVAWGGAQTLYGIEPDLTCLGKVIGGGLPVGAYAGREKFMKLVSPSGPVYQAGTLSGNPLAMAGGIATLEILKETGAYETLEARSAQLADGLAKAAENANVPVAINRIGSMLGMFFVKTKGQRVANYAEATSSDTDRYAKFFHAMLDQGIYLAPSQYEVIFVGLAHSEDDITRTIVAAQAAFESLQQPLAV
jgi:glutamate-1-semialdehyde 2,1-aminomutase